MVIASIERMTAINSALQIDLTGQATAEPIRGGFDSGIGGSADFMRGALLGVRLFPQTLIRHRAPLCAAAREPRVLHRIAAGAAGAACFILEEFNR